MALNGISSMNGYAGEILRVDVQPMSIEEFADIQLEMAEQILSDGGKVEHCPETPLQ